MFFMTILCIMGSGRLILCTCKAEVYMDIRTVITFFSEQEIGVDCVLEN